MATIYRYMFWQAADAESDTNPRIACDGSRAKHLP